MDGTPGRDNVVWCRECRYGSSNIPHQDQRDMANPNRKPTTASAAQFPPLVGPNFSVSKNVPVPALPLGLATVAARTPRATDDISAGYGVGALWRADGRLFINIQNTKGAAVWQNETALANALPLDAVPTALAAYGTQKLRNGYTGFALDVTRASDSTVLHVAFIGTALDTATLDAFLVNTTGIVTKWYDQSGNGSDATANVATGPTIDPGSTIGAARSIVFNSIFSGTFSQVFMTLPPAVTTTFSSSSAAILAKSRSVYYNTCLCEWSANPVAGGINLGRDLYDFNIGTLINGGGYFAPGAFPSVTPYVAGWLAGGNSFETWRDDLIRPNGGGTGNNTVLAGGFLGKSTVQNNISGYCDMAAAVFYARGLTDMERSTLTASLHQNFKTTPQSRAVLVADGDSMTDGVGSALNQNYTKKGENLLNGPVQLFNFGQSGSYISLMLAHYPDRVPLYNPKAPINIITLMAGTNDIGMGTSAADLQASVFAYGNLARATGFKFLTSTIFPRQSFTAAQELVRQRYNAWVSANWQTYADGLMDFNADPVMGGAQSAASNTTYFVDGTHPTPAGYDHVAQIWAAAINPFLT